MCLRDCSNGNVTANIFGNVSGTFGNFSGNLYAEWLQGNVDGQIGTFDTSIYSANVVITSNNYISDDTARIQYLTVQGETITSTNEHVTISPNISGANNVVKIGGVTALDVPTGNTAQRPAIADAGYVRFNSETGTLNW